VQSYAFVPVVSGIVRSLGGLFVQIQRTGRILPSQINITKEPGRQAKSSPMSDPVVDLG